MIKKLNNYKFITLSIFIFHLINNFIILKRDSVPLYFDEGGFYNLSVIYYKYLFSSLKISKIFHHFHSISTFYPPLAFIARMPFYTIWGLSQGVSVLANLLFLFILIYSVFLIGKYLYNEKIALLAAFLISFYPGVYGFARTNFLTIPVAASVALSFYFLLRTDNFRDRKFSFFFGISFGAGLLIKWLYAIYILPLMLICVFRLFQQRNEGNFGRAGINLLISIATATVIALPWYLPNIKEIIPIMFNANYDNPNWRDYLSYFNDNPFRLGLLRQVILMEQYQFYTYYTILFLYFFFRYIIAKNSNLKLIFLTSFFIPYILFNFTIRDYYSGEICPRYIIPIFFIAAILTAKGVMEIKRNILRKLIIITIILVGIVQLYWVWISYMTDPDPNTFTVRTFQRRTTRGLLSPKTVDWKIDEIINTIRDNRMENYSYVLIIPHTPLTSALAYKLELNKETNLMFPLNATFVGKDYFVTPVERYKELIKKADFILTQEGGKLTYDDAQWMKDSIEELIKQFEHQKSEFSLLKEIKVDIDEGDVKFLIYKRNKQRADIIPEPKGEGILIHAVDFDRGNLVYNSDFGLVLDGGISPAYVTYQINLPYDGVYELWVRYATRQTRPVEIYFDGVLKKSDGLTKFTEGWSYFDSRWFKELDIMAKKGRHSLRLIAFKTPFPHIDSIKIIYKPEE